MMDITNSMTVIANIFLVFTFGAILALFSYFIDYCLWENSIFSGYLPRLARLNLRVFRPAELAALRSSVKSPEYDNNCIIAAGNLFFYKILGGCTICSNVWLGLISFIIINLLSGISWWFFLPYVLSGSFVLRRILK